MRARTLARVAAIAMLVGIANAETPAVLPIYLEDNHAGSFFYLASTLDLDEPHALVLIDTHTDASAVASSDKLRDGLRQVRSKREREEKLDRWRKDSTVQAFNWIEPLMPLPFSSVWWVAPPTVTDSAEVGREFLDSRLDFEVRRSGALGEHFHRVQLGQLAKSLPAGVPVVASIDLDYFAAMSAAEIEKQFLPMWEQVLALPRLTAVTFCISRPWLKDDAQGFDLCQRALAAALSLRNSTLRFEPFAVEGPDRSELAKKHYAEGSAPTRFDINAAPPALRSLILANADRLDVRYSPERWEKLLAAWRAEQGAWRVVVDHSQPSTDGVWRLRIPLPLRVTSKPRQGVPRQVRWVALRPEHQVYNILPDIPASKIFASAAPPVVREIETEIAVTEDGSLTAGSWRKLLDSQTGWGSVRVAAEVSADGKHWQRTPAIELRVFTGEGFRAGLSEQFNLPYIFGAGFLRQGGETGPETLAGNDCANFLIYAWRRAGVRLQWGDPQQMAQQLHRIATDLDADSRTPIPPGAIGRGLAIHAGKHAAAVWEDREPVGVLDGGDLVAHHLSGVPELLTLRELMAARPDPHFDLLILPTSDTELHLVVGGDVNLAGVETNPLGELPSFVAAADIAVFNLECALTNIQKPQREKTFLFRNAPASANWLRDAGVTAVSLANNHSGDFGPVGLKETEAALDDSDVASFKTKRPWTIETEVGKLAFLGINYIENPQITNDLEALSDTITAARSDGAMVVVMPHWGQEYSGQTTALQRQRARWLIDHGTDIIVGAHPHRVQPLDFYRGRPIYYSLGNAFFPGDEGPEGFHDAGWARFSITHGGIDRASLQFDP